ncbi:hypothetical protein ACWGE1_13005 [Streptomyces sp. NPDC054932]
MGFIIPRYRTQRLLLVPAATAAAAALVTGGVLPSAATATAVATGAAAPTPTPTPATSAPPTAEDWVKNTDAPSGISADLPGTAEVRKSSVLVDGRTVDVRAHVLDTPTGGTGFVVHDLPGNLHPLEDNLTSFVNAYNRLGQGVMTTSRIRRTTVDGRPALDAHVSGKEGPDLAVGSIRIVSDDDHLVMVMTYGPVENEKDLKEMHERVVDSLRIP